MSKQTAVEWLAFELLALFHVQIDSLMAQEVKGIFQQAKEMEKERMFEVYHEYQDYLDDEFKNQCGGQSVILTFEEYYNQTLNTNEK